MLVHQSYKYLTQAMYAGDLRLCLEEENDVWCRAVGIGARILESAKFNPCQDRPFHPTASFDTLVLDHHGPSS